MIEFLQGLINQQGVQILIIVIVLDTIFGILRALKEKSLNSTIGIDGIIRKVGMLICIIFLSLIDTIVSINFIGFLPDEIKQFIHIEQIGIADLFNALFIVFEALSILKNMILCKLPIPKKFQEFLEKIMKDFTGELKNKKEGE
ncbi:MAG: phage holin family protein [Candidatus Gastranaerophilales bacterium]|nr:phage holin family protein [Candidatus Gastranaerophilales bacterium]